MRALKQQHNVFHIALRISSLAWNNKPDMKESNVCVSDSVVAITDN
jgi:hypothetical protein